MDVATDPEEDEMLVDRARAFFWQIHNRSGRTLDRAAHKRPTRAARTFVR
jgi:hypothetical protein